MVVRVMFVFYSLPKHTPLSPIQVLVVSIRLPSVTPIRWPVLPFLMSPSMHWFVLSVLGVCASFCSNFCLFPYFQAKTISVNHTSLGHFIFVTVGANVCPLCCILAPK